nr:hypothetical protein [Vibrio vulnificus]
MKVVCGNLVYEAFTP